MGKSVARTSRRLVLSTWKKVGLCAVLVAAFAAAALVAVTTAAAANATLHPDHVGATNPGFEIGSCPAPPEGQEGWWGWHFIMPGNENFTSLSVTFQNAGTFSANPFPGSAFVAHPDQSHAYIWTPGPDTLVSGTATSSDAQTRFNLSHVCPGTTEEDAEHLTVTKTASTSFDREHFWDIDKRVETENEFQHEGFPKVWLYTDGRGDETATWTVDVTYDGSVDSNFNVSGTITIENDGDLDANITAIEDLLAGEAIDVDCGEAFELPYVLPVGETLECTYSENAGEKIEGVNEVTVSTDVADYVGEADIVWGDPASETNKTVNVQDISDLFGTENLGSVTAPNGASFTYTKEFAFADYADCGDYSYGNTASIVETGQSASATLKVNVQCFLYETAFAKGSGTGTSCFLPDFSRWGWTNQITAGTYTWDLWAAAGQCDTSNGTLVGSVTVTYGGAAGPVSVVYDLLPGFALAETHVYSGCTKYPKVKQGKNMIDTVAPGQYTNTGCATSAYVIAHAVVGIPDPSFGP